MVPAYRAVVSNARVRRKAQCRTLSAASIYSSLHPGKDGLGVRATFQARGALVGSHALVPYLPHCMCAPLCRGCRHETSTSSTSCCWHHRGDAQVYFMIGWAAGGQAGDGKKVSESLERGTAKFSLKDLADGKEPGVITW